MTGQTNEPKTILDQGYLIVRCAIEPDRLEPVRATAELFLDRARERSRGDPNVGWDAHRVPHPALYDFIDRDTAALFDPLVSDRVLDVNRRLMAAPEVGLNTASLFTEPGKLLSRIFQWHRDSVLRPSSPLPLSGLQADCQANAPGVLSWNIALHDDDSLWVVPASNRRGNTAVEQEVLDRPAQLADEPLPGARRCELAAGDAVVFDAAMLHSGSNDADRYRRTFNVAYRELGGPVLAHSRVTYWKPDLFGAADSGDGAAVRALRTAAGRRAATRSRPCSGPSSNGTGRCSGNTWHGCIPDGWGAWSVWCSFTRSRMRSGNSPRSARKRCPTRTIRR